MSNVVILSFFTFPQMYKLLNYPYLNYIILYHKFIHLKQFEGFGSEIGLADPQA